MKKLDTKELTAKVRIAAPQLAEELKEEWKACERYCKERRKQNWENRKGAHGVQGMSNMGTHQEQMKLPRLAQFVLDKYYPDGEWIGNKAAMDWAWKQWPQFRLVDKR